MNKSRLCRLASLSLLALSLHAAPSVGTTKVTPTSIPAGTATVITVTSLITDPSLIATSVNLQRLDASGAATVLGVLHDDGLNGDAVANDHIYTLQLTLTEPITGPISFRVSAAFKGLLARLFSSVFTVTVTSAAPIAPKLAILAPPNLSYLNLSSTTVNGTVDDRPLQSLLTPLRLPLRMATSV
ncbi:MAG: choice-of-anchor X domain-containing protein [Bryobacteraceae bacterium]